MILVMEPTRRYHRPAVILTLKNRMSPGLTNKPQPIGHPAHMFLKHIQQRTESRMEADYGCDRQVLSAEKVL